MTAPQAELQELIANIARTMGVSKHTGAMKTVRQLITAHTDNLIADIESHLPAEPGNNLHICKPKIHTVDPTKLGFKGSVELEKAFPEYSNCVLCGAKPSQFRYETMTEGMAGFSQALKQLKAILATYKGKEGEK